MRRRAEPAAAPLPDEEDRRAIREDLGTTVLVEASAGTGKTQSLIDRMTALVATGATSVDRLSAVTFTIRAAAQLRQRFQNALEKGLREEGNTVRRNRLAGALAGIDSCFVGTIHAFAARLLRERPVEAGLDPRFREMDEPEDGVARNEAWDRFAEGLFFREDVRLARLIELGIPLEDLRESFQTLCENSDVEVAVDARSPEPDFSRARVKIEEFLDRAAASLPEQVPAGGWSNFQKAVRRAERLRGLLDSSRGADFVQILRVLRPSTSGEGAGPHRKFFETIREDVVKPSLAAWAEHVYPDVMLVLVEARDEYAAWRRREGRLNFQDLLVCARDLLRDHPPVREALRQRFTPILVDEFQDTDPIQAEILFYLTGERTDESDWRRLSPVAGSLFVVGDPKQSIYRFRRADIQTYQVVRDRISQCGRVLQLSVNFRSNAPLCEWVNGAFGRLFPKAPMAQQPAYVPLVSHRPERSAPAPVVFRIETRVPGRGHQPVVDYDAARIAGSIAAAVEKGERRPGDFLLLFRKRRFMADYARAIEDRGIPYEQGGGDAFGASQELADLLMPLAALADPDNPVPLVAALRGPLFGVDDEALYRFARAGGRFSFHSDVPLAADPRIREAFGILRSAETLVETLPPAAAIARFAERIGWVALAASRNLGESRAGNLLKAFAAARKLSAEGLGFLSVVRELERLRQESLIEQMSVEPGRPDAVRLLTLHGAKGLEAPVVFLAEPASKGGRARSFWIDRASDPPRGYFRVVKRIGDHGEEEIARPPDWERMEEIEKDFDAAENNRLLYVGATRAQEALVVSLKTSKDGKASGPWSDLAPRLTTDLPQTAPAPVRKATAGSDASPDLQAFQYRRAERLGLSGTPTYAVVSVTSLSHSAADARPAREDTGRGMEWGRIIHGLLEALMRDAALDVRAYAANLFAEEERQPGDLEEAVRLVEAVRGSPLWRRALAAKRRLVEVPFAVSTDSRELGRSEGPKQTLLSGAIDLAFEEDDGWTLVDYKSDRVDGKLAALTAFYAPQIRHYRSYWERLTRRPTRACLFFVETGEEAWLPEA